MQPRLGPFVIDAPLGEGGMGEVWRGVHEATGLPVAVKVVRRDLAAPRFLDAFRREVETVAALDHPTIVRVYDHGTIGAEVGAASGGRLQVGAPYLVMEHAGDGSLSTAGYRGWEEVRSSLLTILDALAHAHARGVVHRDLKPANVLVASRRDLRPGLKLADFGLAHPVDTEGPAAAAAGTPAYMAPEQVQGRWRDFGPATDLYALGVLAWELVVGRPPFVDADTTVVARMQIRAPLPPLHPRMPVPPDLEELLGTVLAKDPRHRPGSAAELSDWLLSLGPPEGEVLAAPELAEAATIFFTLVPLDGASDTTAEVELPAPPLVEGTPGRARRLPASWETPEPLPPEPGLLGVGLGLFALRRPPIVGRSEERDRLWSTLREVCETGSTRLLTLQGPPGIGKSRLAGWLCHRARELGIAEAWEARFEQHGGHLDGLSDMIERLLHVRGLPEVHAVARARRFADPEGVVALARGSAPDPVAPAAAAIRDAADEGPLVVWLDDAQRSTSALRLAELLLDGDLVTPRPLLLVLTVDPGGPDGEAARDEAAVPDAAAWTLGPLARLLARPTAVTLPLSPLAPREMTRLLDQMLGLDGPVVAGVVERSGGNPRLALGILGEWVERGLLVASPQGFALTGDPTETLPGDLAALWRRRVGPAVEEASPAEREALAVAALLGRSVQLPVWRAACSEAGLDPDPAVLARLARRGLLTREADTVRFVDELVRRLLVEASESVRHLELACARAVDEGDHERRGLHLYRAGEPLDAFEPLTAAIHARREAEDYGGALRLADLAGRCLAEAGVPREDPRHGELGAYRTVCRINLWDLEETLREGSAALADAPRTEAWQAHRARILLSMGAAAFRLNRLDEAWAWLREGLEAAVHPQHRAALLRSMSNVCMARGALRASRRLARAYGAIARAEGDDFIVASAENDLGAIARRLGDPAAGERHLRAAIAICETHGYRDVVVSYCNLADLLVRDGRTAEAHELAGRALDLAREGDSPFHLCAATTVRVHTAVACGDRDTWAALLPRLGPLLRGARLLEGSIASTLRDAAESLLEVDPAGSRIAAEVAAQQYEDLGRPEHAAHVRERFLAASDRETT